MNVQIKICGMKIPENIHEIAALHPDYLGFIFFQKSPRFVGNLNPDAIRELPHDISKVGVFVNESPDIILHTARTYDLQAIQLHGNETTDLCNTIKDRGLTVIKAISIAEVSDLNVARQYESCCNYLLFDTKTPLYGGSGKQYDWDVLQQYGGNLPFFLSGGIGIDDAERILSFRHPKLKAIDLNSRFEITPGIKDTEQLRAFLYKLRTNFQNNE